MPEFPAKFLPFVPKVKDLILEKETHNRSSSLYEFKDGTEVIDTGHGVLWLQSKHHQNRIIMYKNESSYTEVRDNETGGYELIEIIPEQSVVRWMPYEELEHVKTQSTNSLHLNTSEVDKLLNEWLSKNDYQQMLGIMVIIQPL